MEQNTHESLIARLRRGTSWRNEPCSGICRDVTVQFGRQFDGSLRKQAMVQQSDAMPHQPSLPTSVFSRGCICVAHEMRRGDESRDASRFGSSDGPSWQAGYRPLMLFHVTVRSARHGIVAYSGWASRSSWHTQHTIRTGHAAADVPSALLSAAVPRIVQRRAAVRIGIAGKTSASDLLPLPSDKFPANRRTLPTGAQALTSNGPIQVARKAWLFSDQ